MSIFMCRQIMQYLAYCCGGFRLPLRDSHLPIRKLCLLMFGAALQQTFNRFHSNWYTLCCCTVDQVVFSKSWYLIIDENNHHYTHNLIKITFTADLIDIHIHIILYIAKRWCRFALLWIIFTLSKGFVGSIQFSYGYSSGFFAGLCQSYDCFDAREIIRTG